MRIARTAHFDAPVAEVFRYIADFRTLKDYNPSILAVDCESVPWPAEGDRFALTLRLFGLRIRPLLTITELVENERLATTLDAFIPARELRLFRAVGKGTSLTFTIDFDCGWPLIGPLVDRFLAHFFAAPQADVEIRHLSRRFNHRHPDMPS